MKKAARVFTSRIVLSSLLVGPAAFAAPERVGIVVDAVDAPSLGARARDVLVRDAAADDRVRAQTLDVGFGVVESPLHAADAALVDAQHQFHDMDLDKAAASATTARDVFEANLVELAARETGVLPLRDAQLALAKIKFFGGDTDGAKEALRRAFALDQKLFYSPTLFPHAMRRTVVEARLLFDTLGGNTIAVTSTPPGADVYLDGKLTATKTPASIEASAGPHAIELRLKDFVTATKRVDLDEKGAKVELALEKPKGLAADARAITKAMPNPSPAACESLAKALDVESLVLVHVGESGDFVATGELYLAGKVGAPIEKRGAQSSMEGQVELLGKALLDERAERRTAMLLAATPPRENGWQHFRKSKTFWYVVGGVAGAVAVGLGVGLGVGLTEAHQREIANTAVLLGGR